MYAIHPRPFPGPLGTRSKKFQSDDVSMRIRVFSVIG